jgi:hypothetical protein
MKNAGFNIGEQVDLSSYKVTGLIPAAFKQKLNLMPRGFHERLSLFERKMAQICDYLVGKIDAQILFYQIE